MDITFLIIQGILTLGAFIAGAYIYHRGTMDKPPLPLDFNKQEIEAQPEWDQV